MLYNIGNIGTEQELPSFGGLLQGFLSEKEG